MSEREYQALRGGCALLEAPAADLVELAGEDRERFLNGMLTCDVRGLAAGQGRYGFFTNGKGRILADVAVRSAGDLFLLELPAAVGEKIVQHLQKFVITDRVELSGRQSPPALLFAGPEAGARLSALLGEASLPRERWGHRTVDLSGRSLRILAEPRYGIAAFRVWAPDSETLASLVERGRRAGALAAAAEDLETVRVERGAPAYGVDFGEENFPQETGLDEAVSYDKGCYLGQEVVARIHYRGGVNRTPRGLLLEGERPPRRGVAILHDGREAGRLTSAVRSPALGRAAGLSLLHKRAAEPGTRVEIEGGGDAEVAELPLA